MNDFEKIKAVNELRKGCIGKNMTKSNYDIEDVEKSEDNAEDLYKANKSDKKVEKVMKEFESGSLKSSSGEKIVDRKQAIAIALSEAGLSKNK